MGLAATLVAAAAERLAGRAAGGTDRLVDRQDDVGDARLAGRMSEQVAAARPAHGTHKAAKPELGEELPQIGQRELLPLGAVGQRVEEQRGGKAVVRPDKI